MINLNSDEYLPDKIPLTRSNVLDRISEYSMFRYYIGDFTIGKTMHSPFREDKNPSFTIFYNKRGDSLLFKDWGRGVSGDCFAMIMFYLYPSYSYTEVLAQIVTDFGLRNEFIMLMPKRKKTKRTKGKLLDTPSYTKRNKSSIGISARKFAKHDYLYWYKYGVDRYTLRRFTVVPLKYFSYGKSVYLSEKYSYAYIEKKDKKTTYKVYQPFSKSIKFMTDMDASIHGGYQLLPKVGDVLLITKSMKDVMSIFSTAGYPSIAMQSETIMVKDKVMEEYKRRFKHVIVFFDNDEAGKRGSSSYEEMYNIKNIQIDENRFKQCKDYSDVVFHYGTTTAATMLRQEISFAKAEIIDDLPF